MEVHDQGMLHGYRTPIAIPSIVHLELPEGALDIFYQVVHGPIFFKAGGIDQGAQGAAYLCLFTQGQVGAVLGIIQPSHHGPDFAIGAEGYQRALCGELT